MAPAAGLEPATRRLTAGGRRRRFLRCFNRFCAPRLRVAGNGRANRREACPAGIPVGNPDAGAGGRRGWYPLGAMAKPIQPTPPLRGPDAEQLLRELENVCSPEEAKRRSEWARRQLAELMKPKGRPGDDGTPRD